MSLLTKTIHVIGEKIHRNNRTENTLAVEVDKALSKVFDGIRGNVVDVINKVDFTSNQALITVLYEPLKAISEAVQEKKRGGKE